MKFILTCGGTAGHVNPALAVAGRLKELMPDSEFLFIGAKGKMEMNLVPREGYEIKGMKITSVSRGKSPKAILHNIGTVMNVISSTAAAKKIIREFKPNAVIGTGGYVCYPVLKAAADLGIPTLVHESNAVPGLTTKMLENTVDRIMVGFEESVKQYKHPERVIVTGTPVRGEFDAYTKEQAKRELGLDEHTPLVVSVWGSLGAGHMNKIMTELIPLMKGDEGFHLIHATGKMYNADVMEKLSERAPDFESRGVTVREYIYDMPRVMAAADLIMCRAGASTLAELTYMGKPVIIVPSPNVTNNHQEKNARVLEAAGGAKLFLEGEFTAETLLDTIKELLGSKEELKEMSRAMRALSVTEATEQICGIILDCIGEKEKN